MASKKTSEILELRRQGLGYKRITAVTGYSVNTVKSTCRRHPPVNEKVCLQCGGAMVQLPHRKEKKFCSDKCRMAWWKDHPERMARKAFYHLVCAHCGQPFESYGNDHRKYCSRACYDATRRKGWDDGLCRPPRRLPSGHEPRQGYAPPGHYLQE